MSGCQSVGHCWRCSEVRCRLTVGHVGGHGHRKGGHAWWWHEPGSALHRDELREAEA